ncbi:formylglycine-generating enzyme family protein, partial [Haliangium sp.]|uniref:formylglycine-generating enzyme family protein n=1 Tax=Haliangium sp. TaxID=2663208 RepID=UPI003D1430B2
DTVLNAVAEVASEEPPAEPPAEAEEREAWQTLQRLAEQVEAAAPAITEAEEPDEDATDVLLVCTGADEAATREVAERMTEWGWRAEVTCELHIEANPHRRAHSFVVVGGEAGRGPWQHAETRRCLLELSRRARPMVLAWSDGGEGGQPPQFLQTNKQGALGSDPRQSSLPKLVADMLRVGVPEVAAPAAAVVVEASEARVFVEPMTKMRFLWVPGGTFMMGADDVKFPDFPDVEKWSQPVHRVQVSPFWLAETPVTNRHYEQFLKARPGSEEPRYWRDRQYNQAEQPVVGVSWLEAAAFCEWLAEVSGRRMVLPTEAQWEFAARSEDGRRYPWGNEEPDESRAHYGKDWDKDAALPVGSRPAGRGPYGHLDLAGNVWEWCHDAWDEGAYRRRTGASPTLDPYTEPPTPTLLNFAQRACRGGAYLPDVARDLRAAYRGRYHALSGFQFLGFRVAALPASP